MGGALMLEAAAVASFVLLALSSDAAAQMRCSYSGAPENQLSVTAGGEAFGEIRTRRQEILPWESFEGPVFCRGGVPTVLNTDTVRVQLRGELISVDLSLAGGPFAPGATPEAEGASEIEIQYSAPFALVDVVGTARTDEFHWGPGGAHAGLNLNPHDLGDQDVDVTVRGRFSFLVAQGAGGNDTIVPAPGALFSKDDDVYSEGGRGDDRLIAPRNSGGVLEGEAGDDVHIGGRPRDLLIGGGGNDRLRGAGGPDLISAGPGRDLIFGGPGRDRINTRDSTRDRVRCGGGRDRVKADRQDRLRGCEVVRRG